MTSHDVAPAVDNPFDISIFEEYIRRTYTNANTRKQYLLFIKRLEPYIPHDGTITQTTINRFLTSISGNTSYANPFYRGALQSIVRCYKQEYKRLGIEIEVPKIRSAQPYKRVPKFLPYNEVAEIVRNMENLQLKVMVRLYFETGLRSHELIAARITDIDLKKRTISGIGKRNQPFVVKWHSPHLTKWVEEWLSKAPDPAKPFVLYGTCGGASHQPLKNQGSALDYYLKKECKRMGKAGIHVHRFRHALGHFLRADKGFDLAEVKTKLRHRSITSTEIYAPATQEEVDTKIDRKVFGIQDEEDEKP